MIPVEEYNELLKEYGFPNIFENIYEISYTKKINIIKGLINKYDTEKIKKAFNDYIINYIRIDRVNLVRLENTLKYLCERI